MGEINGRMFLNNAGLGLYARMIEQRERDKRRFDRRRLVAFALGLRTLLRPSPLYTVDLLVYGRLERRQTTTLFFGCNARQLADFNLTAAACVQHQQLAVLSLTLRTRWEIASARAAGAALIGRLEAVEALDTCCTSTVRVQTRHRTVTVAIDGELARLRPPLWGRDGLAPGAVVITPASRRAGSRRYALTLRRPLIMRRNAIATNWTAMPTALLIQGSMTFLLLLAG